MLRTCILSAAVAAALSVTSVAYAGPGAGDGYYRTVHDASAGGWNPDFWFYIRNVVSESGRVESGTHMFDLTLDCPGGGTEGFSLYGDGGGYQVGTASATFQRSGWSWICGHSSHWDLSASVGASAGTDGNLTCGSAVTVPTPDYWNLLLCNPGTGGVTFQWTSQSAGAKFMQFAGPGQLAVYTETDL